VISYYIDKPITGGKFKITTKFGIVTVLDEEYEVCDLIQQIGKKCPIPTGKIINR